MEKLLDFAPFKNLLKELNDFLPKILGAVVFFIIAWILLKLILFIVRKSLRLTNIDDLVRKIFENGAIFDSSLKIVPSKIIVGFVKWFFILVFLIIGSDLLGLTMVSNEVGSIISYFPQVFSAFVIFAFGVYLATLLKKSTKAMLSSFDLNGSNLISRIVFYIIFLIVTIVALNQAGIQTDIITDNLSLILGAFLASLALGLGLGSRDIILGLLQGFYARKNFKVGQKVRVGEYEGVIESIENITIVIKGDSDKLVLPMSHFSNLQVEILN